MSRESVGPLRVAVLTTFPPRQCGIATFSRDLCAAFIASNLAEPHVIAVNEAGRDRHYPPIVCWCMSAWLGDDYRRVAGEVNRSTIDVVLIQHEYGLFGGHDAGEMLFEFLDELVAPVVTTMHTVLSSPAPGVRRVTDGILERSAAVVVPGPRSRSVLVDEYGAPTERLSEIPHGAPLPAAGAAGSAELVALSFGYVGPNKGIESMLAAMPELLSDYPTLVYRVVGGTHPGELARAGDSYRRQLERLAADLGVHNQVEFVARYMSEDELALALRDATVCVLPYAEPQQAMSGTLARALSAGKAVVATAFRHAHEVADHGALCLAPSRDPVAIARCVDRVLADPRYRRRLEERAAIVSAEMRWDRVAARYGDLLREVATTAGR